jgi:hypothetical protein
MTDLGDVTMMMSVWGVAMTMISVLRLMFLDSVYKELKAIRAELAKRNDPKGARP